MEVQRLLFLLSFVVAIGMTTARPRYIMRRNPCGCQCPRQNMYFSQLATPCVDAIDYVIPPVFQNCNKQLILPPTTVELPYGVGYFESALPFVAQSFAPGLDFLTTGAYIPVASPCDCLTLAAPVCPDIAPLVKPIIL